MKRILSLVWGSVITNGRKFYLLEPVPEKSRLVWMPEGSLRWQVAECEVYVLKNFAEAGLPAEYNPVYTASHLVFGKDACIELLDNPQTVIYVDYFSSDEEDNVSVSPI